MPIAPGTISPVRLGESLTHTVADLLLEMVAPEQVQPNGLYGLPQPYAGFTVDPYAIVSGFPSEDLGLGTSSVSSARMTGSAAGAGYPDPLTASIGSDVRFISDPSFVTNTRWNPQTPQIGGFPYVLWVNKSAGKIDPVEVLGYTYQHQGIRLARPAIDFAGGGYGHLARANTPGYNIPAQTYIYVFIPHAGAGPFWSLYDTGVYQSGAQLNVRYRRGLIEVYTGAPTEGRLLSYETKLGHSEPIIMALAFDVTNGTGRFVVYDRSRTVRSFALSQLSGLNSNPLIGMSVNTLGAADYSKAPDLEMLEIDIWDRALSFVEIEQAATVLKAVYGVGP